MIGAQVGIRRGSVALAIRQLVALGFVAVTRQGRRSIGGIRSPIHYRLTYVNNVPRLTVGSDQWSEEVSPTDEWRRISTDEEAAQALARAAKKQNLGLKNEPGTGLKNASGKAQLPGSKMSLWGQFSGLKNEPPI